MYGKKILGHCSILFWKTSLAYSQFLLYFRWLWLHAFHLAQWITHVKLCLFECRENNKELRRGSFSPDSEDTTAGRHLLLYVYIWFRLPQTPAQLPSKAFQGERRADGVSLASRICISFRNAWELYLSKAKGIFYWSLRQSQRFSWHTKLSPKPSNYNENILWGWHASPPLESPNPMNNLYSLQTTYFEKMFAMWNG